MNSHETDSEKLLKETDAGCKTAVNSIEAVIDRTESDGLHRLLKTSLTTHQKLGQEIGDMLRENGQSGKEPNPMARGMAQMKIDMKMMMENSDHTVANLMMDGCNMGIQKLSEYMNQYTAADQKVKNVTEKLIDAEQKFMDDLRMYL
jgi:hypothetical protein